MSIDFEKSLIYSQDLGWNWHKSWNLPMITVSLEIMSAMTGESLLPPPNIYAHIFAVKPNFSTKENLHLLEIGLKGVNKAEMHGGSASFSGLKFNSTSYNNELTCRAQGAKFHLVVCLYVMMEHDAAPRIVDSRISPPIFVDSRKSARDPTAKLKKGSSLFDPFPVDAIERQYVKRNHKRTAQNEIEIKNNFSGLLSYISAPNIRNKVRHPLFFALRFSNAVSVYYNGDMLPNASEPGFLDSFLDKIMAIEEDGDFRASRREDESDEEDSRTDKGSTKGRSSGMKNDSNKKLMIENELNNGFLLPHRFKKETTAFCFVFSLEEGAAKEKSIEKWKKLSEFFETVHSQAVALVYEKELVKNWLTLLPDAKSLLDAYKKKYSHVTIRQVKKKEEESEEEDSQNEQSYTGCGEMKAKLSISAKNLEKDLTKATGDLLNYYSIDAKSGGFSTSPPLGFQTDIPDQDPEKIRKTNEMWESHAKANNLLRQRTFQEVVEAESPEIQTPSPRKQVQKDQTAKRQVSIVPIQYANYPPGNLNSFSTETPVYQTEEETKEVTDKNLEFEPVIEPKEKILLVLNGSSPDKEEPSPIQKLDLSKKEKSSPSKSRSDNSGPSRETPGYSVPREGEMKSHESLSSPNPVSQAAIQKDPMPTNPQPPTNNHIISMPPSLPGMTPFGPNFPNMINIPNMGTQERKPQDQSKMMMPIWQNIMPNAFSNDGSFVDNAGAPALKEAFIMSASMPGVPQSAQNGQNTNYQSGTNSVTPYNSATPSSVRPGVTPNQFMNGQKMNQTSTPQQAQQMTPYVMANYIRGGAPNFVVSGTPNSGMMSGSLSGQSMSGFNPSMMFQGGTSQPGIMVDQNKYFQLAGGQGRVPGNFIQGFPQAGQVMSFGNMPGGFGFPQNQNQNNGMSGMNGMNGYYVIPAGMQGMQGMQGLQGIQGMQGMQGAFFQGQGGQQDMSGSFQSSMQGFENFNQNGQK